MALPCEPGNNKERCTLCSVALAKKRCAMPRDRDCHSKLPPALPCSHSQPSPSTRVRERERARREHRAEPAQKSNYLSSPAGPHRPRPRKIPNLAAGFSPERPPLLRAELPIPRPAVSLHAAAVRSFDSIRALLAGGGRPSRGQGALIARGLVTSRYQTINHRPFRSADFGVPFVGLGDLFGARTRCSGSGKFGSFRSVRW